MSSFIFWYDHNLHLMLQVLIHSLSHKIGMCFCAWFHCDYIISLAPGTLRGGPVIEGRQMGWGTNGLGDQWVGGPMGWGPMGWGTNGLGDQWFGDQWFGGAMGWGSNGMGEQWVGGPMGWGCNGLGDQWDWGGGGGGGGADPFTITKP